MVSWLTPASGDGSAPFWANRKTNDGSLFNFYKDSAAVGSIGSKDGDLFIHTGTTGLRFVDGGNSIRPVTSNGNIRDNAIDLGGTTSRFKNLYLSGGAYLGGTAAANKLDDYEEGTWSPVFSASNGSFTTLTMDVVTAKYTKVGRAVHIACYIRTDDVDVGTATGGLKIAGLPFASDAFYSLAIGISNSWSGDDPQTAFTNGSLITLQYKSSISADSGNVNVFDMTTGTTANQNSICLTGTYFTTA